MSGGQTGVDRAALDVAAELGLERGGWCPRGRLAEDGTLGADYPLQETPSSRYSERTRWNVRDSDATLILVAGPLTGGTALTARAAKQAAKPLLVVDLDEGEDAAPTLAWLVAQKVGVLNVAGPRESRSSGIYERTAAFLRTLLSDPSGPGPR
ncbi:MAG: putative molybdenum carrier protein [Candidatus Binatia bacterium]|nr:putative molybdenum carrier protein [Candidatus Binatia bacterium]